MDELSAPAHLVIWLSVAALAVMAWRARTASGGRGPGVPLWPSRIFGRPEGPHVQLHCRQSVRLTPQHTLHLVEWEGRHLLIACHPAGATALAEPLPALRERSCTT